MSLTKSLTQSRVPGLDAYVIEKEINHGYFGRVYQAKEVASERRWACKFVQKALLNDRQKRNIQREVRNGSLHFFYYFFKVIKFMTFFLQEKLNLSFWFFFFLFLLSPCLFSFRYPLILSHPRLRS